MTKPWTPGPWEIVPTYRATGDYIAAAPNGEGEPRLIECPGSGGAMSYSTTICELKWHGTSEWKANATLIAEAPALVEALEACTADLEAYIKADYPPAQRAQFPVMQRRYERDIAIVTNARAVLKRVYGEQG